jgi:hypothetical protein
VNSESDPSKPILKQDAWGRLFVAKMCFDGKNGEDQAQLKGA